MAALSMIKKGDIIYKLKNEKSIWKARNEPCRKSKWNNENAEQKPTDETKLGFGKFW